MLFQREKQRVSAGEILQAIAVNVRHGQRRQQGSIGNEYRRQYYLVERSKNETQS
jgi:hypothetical protein